MGEFRDLSRVISAVFFGCFLACYVGLVGREREGGETYQLPVEEVERDPIVVTL